MLFEGPVRDRSADLCSHVNIVSGTKFHIGLTAQVSDSLRQDVSVYFKLEVGGLVI